MKYCIDRSVSKRNAAFSERLVLVKIVSVCNMLMTTIVLPVFKNNDLAAGLVDSFLGWSSTNLKKCNPIKCKDPNEKTYRCVH